MPATSQTSLIDECHSFVSKQSTEKRDVPKRIPRPPNAFILYRSDFLKRQAVPPDVEKRQQNLSRIAGQCWNMLPESEKAIWFSKAAVVREEHRAKYPFYTAGPFHKGTKRPSAKDKRRGSTSCSGQLRARRTRTLYCDGMFAALRDPKSFSPESQASPISASPSSASPLSTSPLSTTTSLSPLSLPHILPPFTLHTHSSRQDSPFAGPDNPVFRGGKFDYPLDSLASETPQWDVIRDLEIVGTLFFLRKRLTDIQSYQTPSEVICSSQELDPVLQQYRDDFASYVPYPDLSQLPKPQGDAVPQFPLIFPSKGIFPSASANLVDCHSLLSDFNFTDALAHCNQSSVPLYPWHNNVSVLRGL